MIILPIAFMLFVFVAFVLVAVCFVRGILKARFTLQSLMAFVLLGGFCVVLMMNHRFPFLAVVGAIVFAFIVEFLAFYFILIGAGLQQEQNRK